MTLRLAPKDIVAQSTSPLLTTADWWERCRLGDIAEVTNGAAFKSARFNTLRDGLPLVRIRDVGQPKASTHYSGGYEDRHLVESGDLLIGMDGDFRVARWTGGRALLNQRVCSLQVCNPDLYCDRFLEYVIQPYLDEIHKVTSSVTVKHLSSRTLTDLPIPLPPRAEQERIVAAIEEHFSRLDAAEDDITKARAKGVTLPSVVLPGLFSTDWPTRRIGEVARVGGGATPRRSEVRYWSGGTIPWVTSGAVNERVISSASGLITEEALAETSVKLWPIGTVLVAMYGEGKTRGKAALLQIESTCNQACAAIDYDRSLGRLHRWLARPEVGAGFDVTPLWDHGDMSKAHEIVRTGMRLAEFFRRFPDDRAAEVWFVSRRWPSGPVCPHCGGGRVSEVASRRPMPYRCRECRKHFSVMSHTLMHASKLGAQTWLLAIFLIVANPKGRSSVQLAADLGVTQKTAWHLAHRIRQALAEGGLPGFDGPVEADETYIGGKARNRHAHKADPGKTAVIGVKDRRTGTVAATPVHEATTATATAMVAATTRQGAEVYTDGSRIYDPLAAMGFNHARVIHGLGEYVRGSVSTNGVENYWSLLKRTYIGTYHYMSDDHLHRYIEEHSFRYNRRNRHVIDKMSEAAAAMEGRSLTYRELTGSRG